MEVEARWKLKLDGSGSSMEVEARWKLKLDGSGSSTEVEARRKWKLDGSGSPLEIIYSLVDGQCSACFGRVCRLQCTMHVPSTKQYVLR